jgi:ABC-type nitrate/sulfonate/bicarbonate transport system substrate-binding protein
MATRRRVLAGLAAGVATTLARPAILRAAEKVTLITPFGFDVDFLEMMNAVVAGHLAREGLDATLLGATGTIQHIQEVIAGQADIGRFSGIDFIRAVGAKDAPLRAFATARQNSGFTVVSLKEKPVRSGADLKGKTVGLLSYGGTTETFIELLLAKAGIAKDDAKLLVTGNNPGEVDFIRQGRIDCFICTYSVAYVLRHGADAAALEFFGVDGPVPAPGQVFHATRRTLEERGDLVMKVLRALKVSADEIVKGPIEPILERCAKVYEIPGAKDMALLAAQERQAIADNWYAGGDPKTFLHNIPGRWQSGADALKSVGFADVKDVSALYTDAFVAKL